MTSSNKYICLICGFGSLDEPPYDEFGCASFSICPCCGTEFGYDDHSTTPMVLREKWISSGMNWTSKTKKQPTSFNPELQLKNIKTE